MIHRELVVGHELGVHALVAHDLAEQAAHFDSSLFLRTGGRSASLRNVVDVLALGLRLGDRVSVWADGLDESEALEATADILQSSA